jgi:hypothetical protein
VRYRQTQWMWLAGFPSASGCTFTNSIEKVVPSTRQACPTPRKHRHRYHGVFGPRGMVNPSRMHPAPVTKSVLPAGILLFTKAR